MSGDINLDIYRLLVKRGLSEADAEAAARRARWLRLPALYHALLAAGASPALALAAVEEVADYADRQRSPLHAIGRNRNLWFAVLQVAIAVGLLVLAIMRGQLW